MITYAKLVLAGSPDQGIEARIDHENDVLTLELAGGDVDLDLGHALDCIGRRFYVRQPEDGWKTAFSSEEKAKLRPVAETLAMLDGNAFFGNEIEPGREWYEGYLSAAHALYEANGGDDGWAGAASFARKPA